MTSFTVDAGPVPPSMACPGCGWMEAPGATVCRSCGDAMPESASVIPEASRQAAPGRGRAGRSTLVIPPSAARSRPFRPAPKTLLMAAAGAVLAWLWFGGGPLTHPPGILIPEEPVQSPVPAGKTAWMAGESRIQPLASYRIKARVLLPERYRWDPMSDLAPLDLGVGWGIMSDETNTTRSEFSNTGRYLSWHYRDPDFPGEAAARCIANMHLLPANDRVRDRLLSLRPGHLVQASGYLVEVHRPGMNPWTSSLTRLDTGQGACEIMWVESLMVLP